MGCVPCMGTPVDCDSGTTSVQPCDDNNSCTIDDEETILDSDGTVCVPCAGTPVDCNTVGGYGLCAVCWNTCGLQYRWRNHYSSV